MVEAVTHQGMVEARQKIVQLCVDGVILGLGGLRLASQDPDTGVSTVIIAHVVDRKGFVVGVDDIKVVRASRTSIAKV